MHVTNLLLTLCMVFPLRLDDAAFVQAFDLLEEAHDRLKIGDEAGGLRLLQQVQIILADVIRAGNLPDDPTAVFHPADDTFSFEYPAGLIAFPAAQAVASSASTLERFDTINPELRPGDLCAGVITPAADASYVVIQAQASALGYHAGPAHNGEADDRPVCWFQVSGAGFDAIVFILEADPTVMIVAAGAPGSTLQVELLARHMAETFTFTV
jgi:hypothetical protein